MYISKNIFVKYVYIYIYIYTYLLYIYKFTPNTLHKEFNKIMEIKKKVKLVEIYVIHGLIPFKF